MSVKIISEAQRQIAVLENEKLEVWISSLGATILKVLVKDADGNKTNVVLAYENQADNEKYGGYLGAMVGRVANRIEKGKFTLNGKDYQLDINNGPNTLHGGKEGFSFKHFQLDPVPEKDMACFSLVSVDGDQHFPGTMMVMVQYMLKDNRLIIRYLAASDQDTLCNLTNHAYFNLSGKNSSIADHILCVQADAFACSDEDGLVTGEIRDVTGTPFDFRIPKKILQALDCLEDEQIQKGNGIDHPFLFNKKGSVFQVLLGTAPEQICLTCKENHLQLKISSSLPQAQIYSGNFLDGELDLNHQPICRRGGICFETQYMPNDIHFTQDTPTILRKGDVYDEATSYQFDYE